MSAIQAKPLQELLNRPLIFMSGKGGVGKTALSESLALAFSKDQKKTLWVTFEDPHFPLGDLQQRGNDWYHLNCDGHRSFEEYIELKIKIPSLAKVFLRNRAVEFLSRTAPGVHELVLLGKVWSLIDDYDRIVCDMPSTGYGLAMFQSVQNFSSLFQSGAVRKDADAMVETLSDPTQTGNVVIGLPEEMPLQEGIELGEYYQKLFPENHSAFLVNRCYPVVELSSVDQDPESWEQPLSASMQEYLAKRSVREKQNLRLWEDYHLSYSKIEEIPHEGEVQLLDALSEQFKEFI